MVLDSVSWAGDPEAETDETEAGEPHFEPAEVGSTDMEETVELIWISDIVALWAKTGVMEAILLVVTMAPARTAELKGPGNPPNPGRVDD